MKIDAKIKPPIFLIEKTKFLAKKRISALSDITNINIIPSPNNECLQESSLISKSVNSNESLNKSFNSSTIKKSNLKTAKWSEEEDAILINCIKKFGIGKWNKMEKYFNNRNRKQIRQRYINHIKLNREKKDDNNLSLNLSTSSDIENGKSLNNKENKNSFQWNDEYDKQLLKEYFLNQKSWVKISKKIPGSSENSVKNRFYSLLRQMVNKAKKQYKSDLRIDSFSSINEKDINNFILIENKGVYDNLIPLKTNSNYTNDSQLFDTFNSSDILNNDSKKRNYKLEILLQFLPELLTKKGIDIIEINKELNQRKKNAVVQIFVIIEKHLNCDQCDNNMSFSTDMVLENLKNAQTEKLGKVIKNMKLKIMSKYFHRFRYNTLGI